MTMLINQLQGGGTYDEHGQVIYTSIMPDGRVMMVDASRGLDYVYAAPTYPEQVKTYVMRKYLHNEDVGDHYADDLTRQHYKDMMHQICLGNFKAI